MEVWKDIQELRNEFRSEIKLLKNTMEGIKRRLDTVEETVNGIEIREQEYKAEAQREKRICKNERILRELCDQSKWSNIHIIGIPEEEEERERDKKCLSEGHC